jgi:hypothetical protein
VLAQSDTTLDYTIDRLHVCRVAHRRHSQPSALLDACTSRPSRPARDAGDIALRLAARSRLLAALALLPLKQQKPPRIAASPVRHLHHRRADRQSAPASAFKLHGVLRDGHHQRRSNLVACKRPTRGDHRQSLTRQNAPERRPNQTASTKPPPRVHAGTLA